MEGDQLFRKKMQSWAFFVFLVFAFAATVAGPISRWGHLKFIFFFSFQGGFVVPFFMMLLLLFRTKQ